MQIYVITSSHNGNHSLDQDPGTPEKLCCGLDPLSAIHICYDLTPLARSMVYTLLVSLEGGLN
jgi:hypothetical protein